MTSAPTDTIDAEPEIFDSVEALDDRKFLSKAKKLAGRVSFVRHAVAMWHTMRDDETPVAAKGVIVGALLYFVLPIDLIPDFMAGLGFTDDAAVIAIALKTVSSYLRPHHYEKADAALGRRA
ncbi:MAG: uncharacterized membrane protein YkvA (DUF1232 family) [Bradymonadia bacterium]|jgi:uncharacterized membrane protein YkvA (DUF1232 family)